MYSSRQEEERRRLRAQTKSKRRSPKEKMSGVLTAYTSLRDIHGNCYTALKYIDSKTHKEAFGTVSGSEDNVRCAILHLAKNWDGIHFEHCIMKIRLFDRMVKQWPHAGCEPRELAKFIKDALK